MFTFIGGVIRDFLNGIIVGNLGPLSWVVDLIMYVIAVSGVVMFRDAHDDVPDVAGAKIYGRIGRPHWTKPYRAAGLAAACRGHGQAIQTKECIVRPTADKIIYYLAPVIFVIPAFMVLVRDAVRSNAILSDLNIGFLYIVALSSTSTIAMLMAGWASNNKLCPARRHCARWRNSSPMRFHRYYRSLAYCCWWAP